jgi:hypothetical protein
MKIPQTIHAIINEWREELQDLGHDPIIFIGIKKLFIIWEAARTVFLEKYTIKNPINNLPIEDIYFGGNVLKTISDGNFSSEQLHLFRTRCLDFYVEGCSQIIQRFLLKITFYKNSVL